MQSANIIYKMHLFSLDRLLYLRVYFSQKKDGVEFRERSIQSMGCSLGTSYEDMRCCCLAPLKCNLKCNVQIVIYKICFSKDICKSTKCDLQKTISKMQNSKCKMQNSIFKMQSLRYILKIQPAKCNLKICSILSTKKNLQMQNKALKVSQKNMGTFGQTDQTSYGMLDGSAIPAKITSQTYVSLVICHKPT